MDTTLYRMRIVRGAFADPSVLDKIGAKTIEKLESNEKWQSIDEIVVTVEQIKELQKDMIRHYDDASIPWYMDGHNIENENDMIVAFGADDGEKGRIFQFSRDDKKSMNEAVEYGIRKDIPKEQMDFMDGRF